MTTKASPWVQPTTATAGRRREKSPAKKSEVPQTTLDARASSDTMGRTVPAPDPVPDGVSARRGSGPTPRAACRCL
ncbi:hypothetical protein GCM10027517_07340 [Phycicoccus ginsengisoli]